MILGFETGKSSSDTVLNKFVISVGGTFSTFERDVIVKQFNDPGILYKHPLPQASKHKWERLDYDLIHQKYLAYCFWGFMRNTISIYKQAIERNIDFYFGDHPYFFHHKHSKSRIPDRRNRYYRIVLNDFLLSSIKDTDETRYKEFVKIQPEELKIHPWKKTGSKILFLAPSHHMCNFLNIDKDELVNKTIEEIKKYTDREIVIREKKIKHQYNSKTLEEDLQDTWATVSFQSNAAIKSVRLGIPSFTIFNKHSAAAPVSLQDFSKIETPYYPENRYEWLCSLCNNQFTEREIERGVAFRSINEQRQFA